jgi:hypothetical protein
VVNLIVEDMDALHAELVAKGVPIAAGPVDQTWGTMSRMRMATVSVSSNLEEFALGMCGDRPRTREPGRGR